MATQANITVDQGSDFLVDIDLTDNTGAAMDLSGHSVAGTIKKSYTSSNSVSFTASVSDAENGIYNLKFIDTDPNALKPDVIDPIPFELNIIIVDDFE